MSKPVRKTVPPPAPRSSAPPAPAVGVFQEPDTVHLLHADIRQAIAQLASVIIGQNDELLAAVKALREEVRALRPAPAPAAEGPAPEPAAPQLETEAPAAETPAVGETLELALTEPEPAAPVRKRRSFADNPEMQEASLAWNTAIGKLAALRKALAASKGQRESRKLLAQINEAEATRRAAQSRYWQLRKAIIAAESNP